MGKKLAIKGHSTRGKEVIELLEMMGGINDEGYIGTNTWKDEYYFLDNGGIHAYDWCDGIKFTLEGFLEKYPFKVGDKVLDKVDGDPGIIATMKWDEDVSDMKYHVAFDNGDMGWYTNDMIEFLNLEEGKTSVKNHKMGPKSKLPSKYYEDRLEKTQSKRDIDKSEFMIKNMILPNKVDGKLEYEIIDGYEFDKVDNNKIILKPIKPKYPKTYAECCRVLGISDGEFMFTGLSDDEYNLLDSFVILKRCREAYWKIAGEEMGLGKPWDLKYGCGEWGYWIGYSVNENEIYCQDSRLLLNYFLIFPTKEMRDAFYENFRTVIEVCKELL